MTLKFHSSCEILQSPEEFGDAVFLFNTDVHSWLAITPDAFEYLEALVRQGEDPVSLGLRMGFSREEIEQFLAFLLERKILISGEPESLNTASVELQSCYFHVTQACNFKCRTCYSWRAGRNSREKELSLQQVATVLEQLVDLGVNTLIISGGEPLIRRDISDILRMAKEEYGIPRLILLTNGSLITPFRARLIASWVDEVSISLDGPSEGINAFIRGSGNFERALQGLKYLQEAGTPKVSLLGTLTHKNLPYLEEFLNLAKRLEVGISFSLFTPVGAGELPENQDLVLTREDLIFLGKAIMEGSVSLDSFDPLHVALESRKGCGVGSCIIAIDYDGGVYPCHMLMRPELRLGTVPNETLRDILSKSPLAIFFHHLTVDIVDTCRDCALRYFCGGGCRASAYSAHHDLLAHDPACPFHQTAIRSALEPLFGGKSADTSENEVEEGGGGP